MQGNEHFKNYFRFQSYCYNPQTACPLHCRQTGRICHNATKTMPWHVRLSFQKVSPVSSKQTSRRTLTALPHRKTSPFACHICLLYCIKWAILGCEMRHIALQKALYCILKGHLLRSGRAFSGIKSVIFRAHIVYSAHNNLSHTHHYGCTHFLAVFAAVLLLFSNIARIGGVRKIRKKGNWHKRLQYENASLRQAYVCRIAAIGTAICKKIKKYRKHPITKVHAHTFLIYKKHILSKT